MADNKAYSESLIEIVKDVELRKIALPEFQRDFRWDVEQTHDLFDSLARDIFIGTIIYGKPSFGIAIRDFDLRPRKGKGSQLRMNVQFVDEEQIKRETQNQNFRIVLDGQQRITSIVRALLGKDRIYMVLKNGIEIGSETNLEEILDCFSSEDQSEKICICLADAYEFDVNKSRDREQERVFLESRYAKKMSNQWEILPDLKDQSISIYLDAVHLLIKLLNRETLVSYYLLDMGLEKFCAFFERSNSRGIQLDFTDILAAKLYVGFNLREKIQEFEDVYSDIRMNRELIVRAIAYFHGKGRYKIDKDYILRNLRPEDFKLYWDNVCRLYAVSLRYLLSSSFAPSQSWLPSENMIMPLMIFLDGIGDNFANMNEGQRKFIEYWYWASAFSGRYSGSSNEVIMEDSLVLSRIAKGDNSHDVNVLTRKLRPRISEGSDIFVYQRRGNLIYRALLTIIYYDQKGVRDWRSNRLTSSDDLLEDHHIYPRGFFSKKVAKSPEILDYGESVANRALMPKITNIKVSDRVPADYLQDMRPANPNLNHSLEAHLISVEILEDDTGDFMTTIIDERANEIAQLVHKYAFEPRASILEQFGLTNETQEILTFPVFMRYQGIVTEAIYDAKKRTITIENQIFNIPQATSYVVKRQGGPARTANGWQMWKYIDESTEERPLIVFRDSFDESN